MHKASALETAFPAALINAAAEQESWRKEVHRPATHTHKWWAQRLGTVFRGLLVSALTETAESATDAFSSTFRSNGTIVLDPFAGSGTTLVEALKLGCKVVGQDINPVATLVQRQAIAAWDRAKLDAAFKEVGERSREQIDRLHRAQTGETVLYYFWVSQAQCSQCPADAAKVDLFSSYIFAKNAYPSKKPMSQALCRRCGNIAVVNCLTDEKLTCSKCGVTSSLTGAVKGASMTCEAGHQTKVISALGGTPPGRRMYAKMVLGKDGKKRYEDIDSFDQELYEESSRLLAEHSQRLVMPVGNLTQGNNTQQAMKWGFITWRDFFTDRQLYCLGLLGAAIRNLPLSPEREALAALFSGTLEFNNVFCSFKGEGTGAVRHMFSHHILKPERVPLEAHPWGTPASSGSFSTLYESRIIRALAYKQNPHDIVGTERKHGISAPLFTPIFSSAKDFLDHDSSAAMIRTGSSATVDLPDDSVDLVLTDPPFFDNVHYSELADFFHAWLVGLHPFNEYPIGRATTRSSGEVQHTEAEAFGKAIGAVWAEAARVLKPTGLLAFTFHQSKPEGWTAIVKSLKAAGLRVVAIHPVKAEMSTAAPKSGASDPSNLDSVVICRLVDSELIPSVEISYRELLECQASGTSVGYSDVQSVIRGTVLARFTYEDGHNLSELAFEASAEADRICAEMGLRSNLKSSATSRRMA